MAQSCKRNPAAAIIPAVNATLKVATAELLLMISLLAGCKPAPAQAITALPAPTLTPTLMPTSTQTLTPTPLPLPTLTPTVESCTDKQGQIVFRSFSSLITGSEFRYRVYLPPCYAATARRYPWLVMLHGYVPDSDEMKDDQWVRLGLTDAADEGYAAGRYPPIVIVMPNGNDASYGQDDGPFGQVIAKELVPDVIEHVCTWDDPARRAIGGLSRGGFWALSVAFSNPGLFSKVGGHSPFVYNGGYPEQNPLNMLDTPIDIQGLTIYIDHGAQDYVANDVHVLVSKIMAHGVKPEYVINPVGQHVEEYWAAHVNDYLSFYTADWPRDVSQYPACQAAS